VLAFRPGVATGTDESVQRAVREQAMGALRALAAVVDAKDHDTHLHSERTADLSDGIARALGWDPPSLERLMSAAYLHDLGKIGIPDAILLKPAALDEAEWRVIRTHPQLGALIAGEVLDEEAGRLDPQPPRALGRLRLPERPRGRGHPGGRPDHLDRERLGRDDPPAALRR
jgi:HD-GYP domain-containing protein (c-di-GMP phosphodiesterase class II)